jgi:hypothetical protein
MPVHHRTVEARSPGSSSLCRAYRTGLAEQIRLPDAGLPTGTCVCRWLDGTIHTENPTLRALLCLAMSGTALTANIIYAIKQEVELELLCAAFHFTSVELGSRSSEAWLTAFWANWTPSGNSR